MIEKQHSISKQQFSLTLIIIAISVLLPAAVISFGLSPEILLVLLVFGGSALLRLKYPAQSLRVILFLSPILWSLGDINLFSVGSFGINLPMVVGVVVTGIYGIHLLIPIREDKEFELLRVFVVLYALLGLVPILLSDEKFNFLSIYLRVYSPFVVLFAYYKFSLQTGQLHKNLNILYYAVLTYPITLLIGYFRGGLVNNLGGVMRISGNYVPATDWAVILSVMAGIVLYVAAVKRSSKPANILLTAVLCSIAFVGVLLTNNRTGWILSFGILAAVALFQRDQKIAKLMLLAGIIVIVLNYNMVLDQVLRYSSSISERGSLDQVLTGRLSVNQVNKDYFIHATTWTEKLLGIGLYKSAAVSVRYYGMGLIIHNDHLAVLVEQGILAFIPYILFQLTLMFLLFRDYLRGLLSRGRIYFDHTAAIMILVTLSFLAGFVNLMYGRVLSRFLLFGALGTYFAIRVIQRNNTSGAERELI